MACTIPRQASRSPQPHLRAEYRIMDVIIHRGHCNGRRRAVLPTSCPSNHCSHMFSTLVLIYRAHVPGHSICGTLFARLQLVAMSPTDIYPHGQYISPDIYNMNLRHLLY